MARGYGVQRSKVIAGLAMGGGVVPFQETWVEQRDREAREATGATPTAARGIAGNPNVIGYDSLHQQQQSRPSTNVMTYESIQRQQQGLQKRPFVLGKTPAQPSTSQPFQETWVEQRDRLKGTQPAPVLGLSDSGVIPGKVNPRVADDTTINAKIGEYIFSPEVVEALGGAKKLDEFVKAIKERIGLPPETGPKRHDQPDSLGRMDKPGLPAKGIAGLADGGSNDGSLHWNPEFTARVGSIGRGIASFGASPASAQPERPPQTTVLPQQNNFSDPGSFEYVQSLKDGRTPPALDVSSVSRAMAPPPPRQFDVASARPPVVPPEKKEPPPPVRDTGTGSITLGARGGKGTNAAPGTFWNTSGHATGGFARNEDLRLKDVALVNDREAYAAQVRSKQQAADTQQIAAERQKQRNLDMEMARNDATRPWYAGGTAEGNAAGRLKVAAIAQQFGLQNEADRTDEQRYSAELGLEGHKYAADAGVEGQQIAAGAHVKAAELGALASMVSAQKNGSGGATTKESQATDKFRQSVYKDTLDRYDWTGISPQAAHDFATATAKMAGKEYTRITDPGGRFGDAYIPTQLIQQYPELNSIRDSRQFEGVVNTLQSQFPDHVYPTRVRNIDQLKPIKRAKDDTLVRGMRR